MVRASIVYTLLVLGFLSLFIFSKKDPRRHGLGRRLIVRSTLASKANASHHESVAFDPVVARLEWLRENRDWERDHFQELYKSWNETGATHDGQHHAQGHEEQPSHWDGHEGDEDDYLNDEHQFNISHRLELLFPLLDTDPRDNVVSLGELQDWHVQQARKLSKQRTDREFEMRDRNKDGLVSLLDYLPHLSAEALVNASTDHGEPGWWKEHFDMADANGDGFLNHTEFNDFLHPEDSRNPKLHHWLRREQIRESDHDKDGKLSLDEFDHVYDVLRYYGEDLSHLHQGHDVTDRRDKFKELDRNMDGFLTEDELEPIMGKLHPGESFYARQQAEYLVQQADENKDGVLTLHEMLEHPYVFYSTAFTPQDSHEEYQDHDEFR
ncbi:hypothetical protein SELMODRAFT_443827 [Selaginella moellendorffii]|uniref:EF-hand domain-containing protein n=1 Tax=Selaginella moellendorffii TaxID=88036 RepID=D8S4Q5_SELML|nr:calumenin isoform X1 [Selaginella moellendorffii]EFJ20472.1 hypothetical protein SELMODRAFT_443827 [Selaginella moellendorffii]|eukprot:XP_024539258.1 calumenin isoform X1 [Selaginella moellendorffii]